MLQETDKLPQMCQVRMSTYEGGGCKASVTCSDGVKREYNDWNVCYVGGRQFFTDPAIGDFSITWTDGGRGLGSPILQVKSVKDWSEWDVSSLSSDYIKEKDYNARPETNMCYRVNAYDSHFNYDYICGVPKVGSKGAGIQADKPVNDRGYAPGWCGMHVVQHQKPNPATDRYRFDITLKDHNGKAIGEVLGAVADKPIEVFSKLPYVFILTGGNVDSDAVLFDYAGQHWGSNDQGHHCDFGAYDNGARQGDCGFSCD